MKTRDEERLKNQLVKQAEKSVTYTPGPMRERVKERFYRRLKEQSHIVDKETVFKNPALLEQLAGTPRIHQWMEDATFAEWWWDEEVVTDTLMAMRSKAVNTVWEILNDDETSPGDKLKAVRMIFEVTDQFPTKKQEVKFIDEELNRMPLDQVDREIAQLQQLVGETSED